MHRWVKKKVKSSNLRRGKKVLKRIENLSDSIDRRFAIKAGNFGYINNAGVPANI